MQVQRYDVTVTTDGSGNATVFSPILTGRIINIIYTADGSTPYAGTVDFTITLEATGQGLWTELNIAGSKTVSPQQPTHDQVGAAALYAAGGTAVRDFVFAANDRVKIALAQGGATTKGLFQIIVG
jgi:hypothetical protein